MKCLLAIISSPVSSQQVERLDPLEFERVKNGNKNGPYGVKIFPSVADAALCYEMNFRQFSVVRINYYIILILNIFLIREQQHL